MSGRCKTGIRLKVQCHFIAMSITFILNCPYGSVHGSNISRPLSRWTRRLNLTHPPCKSNAATRWFHSASQRKTLELQTKELLEGYVGFVQHVDLRQLYCTEYSNAVYNCSCLTSCVSSSPKLQVDCVLSKKAKWRDWKQRRGSYNSIASSVLQFLDAKPYSVLEFGSGVGTNLQHFFDNGVRLCIGLEPVLLGKLGWYTMVEDSVKGPLQFPFGGMLQESTFQNFKHRVFGECNATFDTILILNEQEGFLQQPACPVLNFLTRQARNNTILISAKLTVEKWHFGNYSRIHPVNLTFEWISRGFKVHPLTWKELERLPHGYPSLEDTVTILQATSELAEVDCLKASPKVNKVVVSQLGRRNRNISLWYTEVNQMSWMTERGLHAFLYSKSHMQRAGRKSVYHMVEFLDTKECVGVPQKLSVAIVTIHIDRALYLCRHYNALCVVSDILVVLNKWTAPHLLLNTTYKKPVTFVLENKNTLRNRYRHFELFISPFVLLTDDDFAFDAKTLVASLELLSFKPLAVVSFSSRCVKWTSLGWWYGSPCEEGIFHMGLGQARIIHKHWMVSFLRLPSSMLGFVDNNKPTCEDITFHFMIGNISRHFPTTVVPLFLQPCNVSGVGDGMGMYNTIVDWMKKRSSCLNRLAQDFGGMMLQNNTGIFLCEDFSTKIGSGALLK